MKNYFKILLLLIAVFSFGVAEAQSTRSSVNKGVDLYKEKKVCRFRGGI